MMKKSCILILALLLPIIGNTQVVLAPSEKKIIEGSKELPSEINFLLKSLMTYDQAVYDRVQSKIFSIDRYARLLNKEDLFLVGKLEIYRTLIKAGSSSIRQPIDGNSIKTLKDSLAKTSDPFFKWFLDSLIQDAQALVDNSLFKEYILQLNTSGADLTKYRRIIKKNQLIAGWVQKLNPKADDFKETFRTIMVPIMEECLANIENSFQLLASYGNRGELAGPITDAKDLKFFAVKTSTPEVKKTPPPQPKDKTVEEILSTVEEADPSTLPLPSSENWLDSENTPAGLKNLPKPSNDADWLQDF